jgi:hypothetical protein
MSNQLKTKIAHILGIPPDDPSLDHHLEYLGGDKPTVPEEYKTLVKIYTEAEHPIQVAIDAKLIDPTQDGVVYGLLTNYNNNNKLFFYIDRSDNYPDINYKIIPNKEIITYNKTG